MTVRDLPVPQPVDPQDVIAMQARTQAVCQCVVVMVLVSLFAQGCASNTYSAARQRHEASLREEAARRQAVRRRAAPRRVASTRQRTTLSEQRNCLALSIYWEARGEGRQGMVAVGWTVLNRVDSPLFPATPCAVVRQGGERPPCQFSWWCDGKSDRPRDLRSWKLAFSIAGELLLAPPRDPTGGSLFYHSTSIRSPWARPRARTVRIGRHVFYR